MDMRVSEIHAVHEQSIGEVRHWFERHPTLLTFPFEDLNTKLKEQITNFEQGFELYLDDKAYCKDQEVEVFAEKYESTKVMTWIWMNTEYIHDHEVANYIKQAGELYYQKIGTGAECDSDQRKKEISVIVQALFRKFRELEVPRALQAVIESQREIVPAAQVPHKADAVCVDSSDDEPGTGAQALPGSGSGRCF
jgi:hypothetical protein